MFPLRICLDAVEEDVHELAAGIIRARKIKSGTAWVKEMMDLGSLKASAIDPGSSRWGDKVLPARCGQVVVSRVKSRDFGDGRARVHTSQRARAVFDCNEPT